MKLDKIGATGDHNENFLNIILRNEKDPRLVVLLPALRLLLHQ
jgi:hypothetical protein